MSDFNLETFWPFLIGVISNKIMNSASATYRRIFNVGIAEWRVLSCIDAEQALTAKEICVRVGQDKAAISRALKKLEIEGYVYPVKSKTNGDITSRMIPFSLTKSGKSLYGKMLEIAQVRQEILEEEFSPNERAQFTDYLLRVQKRIPTLIEVMDRTKE